ncbi:MAG: peptidoglycan-binding domain-containing protein [Bacteroidota bacterium]
MKQIIIFLLLVIVGIMGYNLYRNYQRFHPPNYQYQVPEEIRANSSESDLLYRYYQAVEELDAFVIAQWSDEKIDVRNPEDDDAKTSWATNEYANKKAKVRFYETQLLAPMEPSKPKESPSEETTRKNLIKKMYYADPSTYALRIGDQNALVYEIQRLLIADGDSILHDGLFRTETFNALRSYEERNGLFPDGKLDALTLDHLLKN